MDFGLPVSKWWWPVTSSTYHPRKENDSFFQCLKPVFLYFNNRSHVLSTVYVLGTVLSRYHIISFSFPNPKNILSNQVNIFRSHFAEKKPSTSKNLGLVNIDSGHMANKWLIGESNAYDFDLKVCFFPVIRYSYRVKMSFIHASPVSD